MNSKETLNRKRLLLKRASPQLLILLLLIGTSISQAQELDNNCVLEKVTNGDANITIAELRKQCVQADDLTLGDVRKEREQSLIGDQFSILLHRDNYLLPVARSSKPVATINDSGETIDVDDVEVKFQISIRSLLLDKLPFGGQLYAAYTNQSHWQAYASENSRPFRETNHQPEVFVDFPLNKQYRGIKLNTLRFALNHQSNGRSGVTSRSWNRAYAELVLSTKYSEVNLRSWMQISSDLDNPDITDYLGNFQIDAIRKFGKNQFHWKARHNLSSDSKSAVELGWSRGIGNREDVRFYLQYFNGYGESLIDYNHKIERIGLGFKIGD